MHNPNVQHPVLIGGPAQQLDQVERFREKPVQRAPADDPVLVDRNDENLKAGPNGKQARIRQHDDDANRSSLRDAPKPRIPDDNEESVSRSCFGQLRLPGLRRNPSRTARPKTE